MPWINLATLLILLKRAHRDPRNYTIYIPDTDLPIPNPPRQRLNSDDIYEIENENSDFFDEED